MSVMEEKKGLRGALHRKIKARMDDQERKRAMVKEEYERMKPQHEKKWAEQKAREKLNKQYQGGHPNVKKAATGFQVIGRSLFGSPPPARQPVTKQKKKHKKKRPQQQRERPRTIFDMF